MKIKMLVMDVDGTLTDGHIYMGPNGEAMKAFDCKDGYAINQMLPQMGITPVIITGRDSAILANRAQELHIAELHQGVADKLPLLKQIAEKHGVLPDEIAYIGDDLNDLPMLARYPVSVAMGNAVEDVKAAAKYVTLKNDEGGIAHALKEILHII